MLLLYELVVTVHIILYKCKGKESVIEWKECYSIA